VFVRIESPRELATKFHVICVHPRFICVHLRFQGFARITPHRGRL